MIKLCAPPVAVLAVWFGAASGPALGAEAAVQSRPAQVEVLAGGKVKRIVLSRDAADRLGIELDEVRTDPGGRLIVPYSSVLYDLAGNTWIYVSMDQLSFVREPVRIDVIRGEDAFLQEGPARGTKILALGVPEVYGTEIGVGH